MQKSTYFLLFNMSLSDDKIDEYLQIPSDSEEKLSDDDSNADPDYEPLNKRQKKLN